MLKRKIISIKIKEITKFRIRKKIKYNKINLLRKKVNHNQLNFL